MRISSEIASIAPAVGGEEHAIRDVPLCDCTEALLTTMDKDMRRKKPTKKTKKRIAAPVTHEADADFDIIADLRKAKNGAKFIALYDKGDKTCDSPKIQSLSPFHGRISCVCKK